MQNQTNQKWQWNAGTGAAAGVLVAAILSLIVDLVTGDSSIWTWGIPVGLALGVAIGAGRGKQQADTTEPGA